MVFKFKRDYIKRPVYINKVKPYIDKDIIKVLIGQRRVGKSFMLFQIMDELSAIHKKPQIIYISKELDEFDSIKDYNDLLTYIYRESKSDKKVYLFIDEIQDIIGYEKALRSLQAKGNYDIYCTGGNAKLLSGELSTYLSGRYIELKVYSLSFFEFLEFHKLKKTNESLLKYFKYGGLPYLINLELTDQIIYDYLRNIYDAILFKDVVKRFRIRNITFLENLVRYIADNTGSLVSSKKISDFLKSQKINISPQLVLDYLGHLEAAVFIFKVLRADVTAKKIFEISEKYYFEDLGLRNAITGYKLNDINKILENVVFNHLKISGYRVNVGKLGEKEVDFVCTKSGNKIYVQVAYLLKDESTIEREFGNLLEIKDNYPKYVVSMDEILSDSNYNGVIHMHIIEFLSELR